MMNILRCAFAMMIQNESLFTKWLHFEHIGVLAHLIVRMC